MTSCHHYQKWNVEKNFNMKKNMKKEKKSHIKKKALITYLLHLPFQLLFLFSSK